MSVVTLESPRIGNLPKNPGSRVVESPVRGNTNELWPICLVILAPAMTGAQTEFRDCPECPEMVVIPAGTFMMGSDATYDQLILGSDVTAYEVPAALVGTADFFVARFVEADGHCNFTPAQTGRLFDALLAWVREGKRPAPGEHH